MWVDWVVVFIVRAGFGRTLEEGVHEKGELVRAIVSGNCQT
jgi:hypothetical protein